MLVHRAPHALSLGCVLFTSNAISKSVEFEKRAELYLHQDEKITVGLRTNLSPTIQTSAKIRASFKLLGSSYKLIIWPCLKDIKKFFRFQIHNHSFLVLRNTEIFYLQAPVVQTLDSVNETNCVIHWIAPYTIWTTAARCTRSSQTPEFYHLTSLFFTERMWKGVS